jgi:hypothetical protein
MAVSHEREATAAETGTGTRGSAGAPKIPTRLVVPPEIEKTYTAIHLTWKEPAAARKRSGCAARRLRARPGPDWKFIPTFSAGVHDGCRGNQRALNGVEPTNPAARITVVEKGNEIFGGMDLHEFSGRPSLPASPLHAAARRRVRRASRVDVVKQAPTPASPGGRGKFKVVIAGRRTWGSRRFFNRLLGRRRSLVQ